MATTTPNYGWTVPTSTDLVKDGATAIETLGDSVDATVKALNPETTLGDIAYRSSTANTNTRLGIGTTGQVLTVSGGVPSWATPAGGSDTWSLLSTVTLSGLSTTTISSITSNKIALYMVNARTATGIPDLIVRPNNNTTAANYKQTLIMNTGGTGGPNYVYSYDGVVDKLFVGAGDDGNTSMGLWFQIENCKSTSYKNFQSWGGSRASGASIYSTSGFYVESAAMTSLTLSLSSSSFNAGTLYVYGA
jgi:hypothetical protein